MPVLVYGLDPVAQVVIAGHPDDLAVGDREEGSGGDGVGLSGCQGEGAIGLEVGAGARELGGAAISGGHDDQIGNLLSVTLVHVRFESAKGFFPDLAAAFVDVVPHIIVEGGEHAFRVVAVEGIKVGPDEGLGFVHGDIFPGNVDPMTRPDHIELTTGVSESGVAQSRKMLSELAPYFADLAGVGEDQVVYETFGCPGEVEGPARLLYATTVLQPGQVSGEYFMTRGHFHVNPERGENMLTLRGEGALVLMNREGETWTEPMRPGSVHDIDGRHAHRVANTGDEPLVFYVTWLSDCGHDYGSILEEGFGKALKAGPNGPELAER